MTREYRLEITLASPVLIGSGDGWGALIDADVVFDDLGLPFIPARRIKGALRESALEVLEMFEASGIGGLSPVDWEDAFGRTGTVDGGAFNFNNLLLPEYVAVRDWCRWALDNCPGVISMETIMNALTETRDQTSLTDDGVAEDRSLRRSRVLRAGLSFTGAVTHVHSGLRAVQLLALACLNLRYMGTMRHKGCGHVSCALFDGEENLSAKILEEIRKEVA